ncbi:MAG: hypothetical protein ACRDQ0_13590, partial [Pseudonocardia sp.]
MSDTSRTVVDVHAHAVPRELLTVLPAGAPSPPPGLTDVPARLAAMDRMGVDVQVVSPWIELSPDELAPSARTTFLRMLNDGMAELAAHHPDRLRALALLDRHDPD